MWDPSRITPRIAGLTEMEMHMLAEGYHQLRFFATADDALRAYRAGQQ